MINNDNSLSIIRPGSETNIPQGLVKMPIKILGSYTNKYFLLDSYQLHDMFAPADLEFLYICVSGNYSGQSPTSANASFYQFGYASFSDFYVEGPYFKITKVTTSHYQIVNKTPYALTVHGSVGYR
ncbi:hypothetical protein D3C76_1362650 [compost metagenome]